MVIYALPNAGPNKSARFFSHVWSQFNAYYYFEDVFAGFLDMGSWLHEWMCWIFNHGVVFYMQIYHWKWQGHREIYTPEDLERMLGELFEGETRID